MLRKDTKIGLLKTVPLFSHCNNKQLSAIASLADLIEVAPLTELVKEGGEDCDFMVIVEGSVDVTRRGKNLNKLSAGDFFGEIALVSGGPRTATVVATAPTTLLVVAKSPFWALLEETPSLQTSVMRAMGERLRLLVD